MENCGSMLKTVLVVMLVAVIQSGSAAEKLASCCKRVNRQEITEPILGYLVQRANPPCVRAVIFQTKAGLFCSQLTAPWVWPKIVAFEEAKAQATVIPSSPISLLSIITSTASPPSSSLPSSSPPSSSPPSSSLPSSSSSLPSTSQMPAGETATSSIFSTSSQ